MGRAVQQRIYPCPFVSRHALWCAGVLSLIAISVSPCLAEDSDITRSYLALRFAVGTPGLTSAHDSVGFSVGANLNKHVGVELSADFYEPTLSIPGQGNLSELGTLALVPQLRLRYPLFGDRLVPYVIGGVGVALHQHNDVGNPGFGKMIDAEGATLIGAVGGGIEYFVADNVAIGIEGKVYRGEKMRAQVDGVQYNLNLLDTAVTTLTMRIFYPELKARAIEEANAPSTTRLYVGGRIGGALPTSKHVFAGIESAPEPPAYAKAVNQGLGISLGVNIGRYWGFELGGDGYEMRLRKPGVGLLGEYSIVAVVPQVRLRYPLLNEHLVPYVLAGVGLSRVEMNDRSPAGKSLPVKSKNYDVAGTIGAGIDYFISSNLAVGFETKYLISRGNELQVGTEPPQKGYLDTVFFTFGLKFFFMDL